MSSSEIHEMKHEKIDSDIECLKSTSKNHGDRIVNLEKSESLINYQLNNTIESINQLISWIKWGLGIGIVAYLGFFAWLLQQQIT